MPTKSINVIRNESGAALLLFAIFFSLLGAIGAYGFYEYQKDMDQANPHMLEVNRAQAMAYAGVLGLKQYYKKLMPACSGGTCSAFSGLEATASAQETLSGSNVTLSASTISNTLNGISGFITVNSSGMTAGLTQTMQAIMQTGLQSLNPNNSSTNFILNGKTTFHGHVFNKTGEPNTAPPVVVVGSTETNPTSNITFKGTTPKYVQLSVFPLINPDGLKNYSTMQLVVDSLGNATITIPASAVPLYNSILTSLNNGSSVSLPVSNGAYSCTIYNSKSGSNNCNNYLSTYVSYAPVATVNGRNSTPQGWEITSNKLPGFFYSNGNVTVSGAGGMNQITVVADGTITTSTSSTSEQKPAIFDPFSYSGGSGSVAADNYCNNYSSLPICEPNSNPAAAYPFLTGVTFVSLGNLNIGGENIKVNGDIATLKSILLNGGGSMSFGGIIIAKNGIGGSKTEGSITLTQKIAGSSTAALGGLQLNITAMRWL
jgi:hypothetical protein